MPVMHLTLRDPAWPDLKDREIIEFRDDISVAAVPHGMEQGGTSVALRFDLPDGRVLVAWTSLALLNTVTRGIIAAYPDPPGVGMNAP